MHTFLQKNALQKRVLVTEHQAFIRCGAMGSLQIVQIRLMDTNRLLELFYVLRAALAEGSLSLPVPLLAFLGSSIYLEENTVVLASRSPMG